MILTNIVIATRKRVKYAKKSKPISQLIAQVKEIKTKSNFKEALKSAPLSYICEVKKASPSKGVIAENFDPVKIAQQYQLAGATAISVLTEPDFFQGKNEYLTSIRASVTLPLLRKDFIIDAYQIYEAKVIGADAILLICGILTFKELSLFLKIAASLFLDVLVEVHDEKELQKALKAKAQIIGVNNRNLKTFEVDIQNSIRLKKLVPSDVLFVAESGISSREDILALIDSGVDAVLIGEQLMRQDDKIQALAVLKGE
ncbi:MAG: indole-3-glycerol phosphate synthase TrpC [Culicoidibacterales bacterium]